VHAVFSYRLIMLLCNRVAIILTLSLVEQTQMLVVFHYAVIWLCINLVAKTKADSLQLFFVLPNRLITTVPTVWRLSIKKRVYEILKHHQLFCSNNLSATSVTFHHR